MTAQSSFEMDVAELSVRNAWQCMFAHFWLGLLSMLSRPFKPWLVLVSWAHSGV